MQLRDARVEARLTQQEAATRAGMSVQGWRKLERGEVTNPQITTAYNAALAVGKHPQDIEELTTVVNEFEKARFGRLRGEGLRRVLREEHGVELLPHEEAKQEAEAATGRPREESGFYEDQDLKNRVAVLVEMRTPLAEQQRLMGGLHKKADRLGVLEG